ncbi:phosphodiester glycosidase family protein [Actinomycetospora endophytica]|uniref:Phosphodiester glycosidase family protein n=1 Tax=Actinomycetospora endophytica TaxID=2291215 RepID=A0ABS8P9D5_9PSEU|nr:phosphodiester glycosidase family protein [Actinomycetospora endophytica]MCD2193991.1 phosphodiester glycosidase family protein [Actinomycetospora endophytica]
MRAVGPVRPLAGGFAALVTTLVVAPSALAGPDAPAPPPPPPAPPGRVLDQVLGPRDVDVPGTEYRDFTTTEAAGRVRGHVVRVDLANRKVAMALLHPPVVTATATVPDLAGRANAIAAVNADFFDEGGTGAPVGVELADGVPITSAVTPGRRPAPPGPPGSDPDTVLGVDRSGAARIDTVHFAGGADAPSGTIPLTGLNTYAVPVGGVAVFTPAWGALPRSRTVCGSDTDPKAPCSPDAVEVQVRDGKVIATGPVGTGAVPTGAVALVGRDAGADLLRGLRVGDPVVPHWELRAGGSPSLRTAVGALPLVRAGAPWPGLQDTERAPRTAVGLSADGRTLALIAVDGRQQASVGATLAQLGRLVSELGYPQAVAFDGGGSTQMVRRPAGGALAVANSPSDVQLRRIRDALAVVPGGG